MKKDEWLIVFLPLLTTWYLDRISKMWAVDLIDLKSYGYLHFALHHNPGAMLGLFADLPPFLRIVSLSTGGAFLVVTYALLQYLLPIKSLVLRSGMSILLGGILGNVTDRIVWGHVVDFIILGTPELSSPAFNVADALQWVGYGFIVYAIIKEGGNIWPENNARRRFWINPKFQLKYSYLLLGVGLSISFVALVFAYTYMRVAFIELAGQNPDILKKFLNPFLVTFGFISVGFSMGLFTVGKVISHKIAGPIYAFEKYMNELVEAKQKSQPIRQFKLRTHDEFKELEIIGRKVKDVFYPDAITVINENQKADTDLYIEEGMDKPPIINMADLEPERFADPGFEPLKSQAFKNVKDSLQQQIHETQNAPAAAEPVPMPKPAPIVQTQAPIVQTQAPIVQTQAPIVQTRAPVTQTPAPVQAAAPAMPPPKPTAPPVGLQPQSQPESVAQPETITPEVKKSSTQVPAPTVSAEDVTALIQGMKPKK